MTPMGPGRGRVRAWAGAIGPASSKADKAWSSCLSTQGEYYPRMKPIQRKAKLRDGGERQRETLFWSLDSDGSGPSFIPWIL